MSNNRISYVPLGDMDERMQEEMGGEAGREGTPRPEEPRRCARTSRARSGAFAVLWKALFHDGVCDHAIKELCRVYVSRTVRCEFCGNQRSSKATAAGLAEQQYDALLNFESSDQFDERQKTALAYAEAISWRIESSDELWDRLHRHFSEAELVELGCFIALTLGQQSWIRLLGIDHHEYMGGTDASLAPGFGTAEELAASKMAPDYWAVREAR